MLRHSSRSKGLACLLASVSSFAATVPVFLAGDPASFAGSKRSSGVAVGEGDGDGCCAGATSGKLHTTAKSRAIAHARGKQNFDILSTPERRDLFET
jgi:hypothetical protein